MPFSLLRLAMWLRGYSRLKKVGLSTAARHPDHNRALLVRFKRLDPRFLEIGVLRVIFTKKDPEFPGISGQVVSNAKKFKLTLECVTIPSCAPPRNEGIERKAHR
eukprot:sb/3477983/